jgi:predicted histone-like DNA-binding protein
MIQIKAKQQNVSFEKNVEKLAFVLSAHLYNTLDASKVIEEAAKRSGISVGVIKAAWDAAGEVIRTWATEGHNVSLPGLGSMRFGVRSKSVQNVEDVKTTLISARRVIFTPSKEVKDELQNTKIAITCYDKDGNIVKRVTSADSNDVEDPEGGDDNGGGNSGGTSGGSSTGGNTTNSGSGSQNSGNGSNTGSNTGGNSGSGTNTGGNSGSQSGSGESGVAGNYRLVIYKYGSGTSNVTDANGQELANDSSVASGTNVNISVVPAEGKVPTAKVNGNSITLTENNGTYTGSFVMPTKGTVVEVNSEPSDIDWGDDH